MSEWFVEMSGDQAAHIMVYCNASEAVTQASAKVTPEHSSSNEDIAVEAIRSVKYQVVLLR